MTESYELIQHLFLQCCKLPVAERTAFLESNCNDDVVRTKVRRMLEADDDGADLQPQQLDTDRQALLSSLAGPTEHTAVRPPLIDGFVVQEQIGAGGMGAVWRATQASTNRDVALKVLTAQRVHSEKARQRFEREIELLATLDHPNITSVFESGQHQGQPWNWWKAYRWMSSLRTRSWTRPPSFG